MDTKKRGFGFVLMPFSVEFKNQWEVAFKPALDEVGLSPKRADGEHGGTGVITTDVTRGIYESQIILADITGKNPNVMYELGLAHAAKKPVIILAQSGSDVPFDIRHVRYMNYSPLDLIALKTNLAQRIRNTLAMVDSPPPDLFPQLKIMTTAEIAEFEYLRERMLRLDVIVDPPTADIFFNDKWMGQTPQTIRINMLAGRRVLAATASGYVEYYQDNRHYRG